MASLCPALEPVGALHSLERSLGAARRTPGEWIRELDAAVRRDFARGDTVSLEGWVLSRTEAEVCAVAAASGPSGARLRA